MKFSGSTIFTSVIVVIIALAVFEARDYPFASGMYPWVIGITLFTLSTYLLIVDTRRLIAGRGDDAGSGMTADIEARTDMPVRVMYTKAARTAGWIMGLCLGMWVFGMHIAVSLFFITYLRLRARAKWYLIPVLTVFILLFLFAFDKLLGVWWPEGWIEQWITLPWVVR